MATLFPPRKIFITEKALYVLLVRIPADTANVDHILKSQSV